MPLRLDTGTLRPPGAAPGASAWSEMRLSASECRRRATSADHAILSTLHAVRGVDSVPVCFILDGDIVAIAIDEVKPKSGRPLQRLRNLERDPRAALLVEHWDQADWSRLWWVRLALRRSTEDGRVVTRCEAGLRAKYSQYAAASFAELITFRVVDAVGWSAS